MRRVSRSPLTSWIFHTHIPIAIVWEELSKFKHDNDRNVVALGPRMQSLPTFYSPNHDFGSYAHGEQDFARVFKEAEMCDKIIPALNAKDQHLPYHECRDQLHALVHGVKVQPRERSAQNGRKKIVQELRHHHDTSLLIPKDGQEVKGSE